MEKIGQTEVIYDNLSPEFATSLMIDYHFEEQQIILVRVLDVDECCDCLDAKTGKTVQDILYHHFLTKNLERLFFNEIILPPRYN